MLTRGIVEAFDEGKDGHARLGVGSEAAAIDQFALERREEALAHGIVIGIANRAGRRPHAGFPAAIAESNGRVLRAADALLFVKRRFEWR